MSKVQWGILGVPIIFFTAALAYAATSEGKLAGDLTIFGGYPGDITPPTAKDAKLGLYITGPAAARLYRELGPKSQDAQCQNSARIRGDIMCATDGVGDPPVCWIDFNLRTGKSIRIREC